MLVSPEMLIVPSVEPIKLARLAAVTAVAAVRSPFPMLSVPLLVKAPPIVRLAPPFWEPVCTKIPPELVSALLVETLARFSKVKGCRKIIARLVSAPLAEVLEASARNASGPLRSVQLAVGGDGRDLAADELQDA